MQNHLCCCWNRNGAFIHNNQPAMPLRLPEPLAALLRCLPPGLQRDPNRVVRRSPPAVVVCRQEIEIEGGMLQLSGALRDHKSGRTKMRAVGPCMYLYLYFVYSISALNLVQ